MKAIVVEIFLIELFHKRSTMNSGGIGERVIAGLSISLLILIISDIN